jgi:SSS family solute:Na+ symporter
MGSGSDKKQGIGHMTFSQIITFVIGAGAILIAMYLQNVLELMLLSYAFMVSGLFVPVVATLFFKRNNPSAALNSMLAGSLTFVFMEFVGWQLPFGLDSNIGGITSSAFIFWLTDKYMSHAKYKY